MIKVNVDLVPYGNYHMGIDEIVQFTIWSIGTEHHYRIVDNDGMEIAVGQVPKTQSGHRNPLRLLKNILNDVDIDSLGDDHITTKWDAPQKNA